MLVRALTFVFTTLLALPAFAEGERTILVLDGSGSMWGQIDGKNKIVIAREVVGGLLSDIPADMELGLTVYGHRRKGDCSDIESVVSPATDTREGIRKAVNAINPKGKTPLSAAVIAAAEELKYSEEKATVILVSDGRETCDADPCEVGRKLEETGVDFTAHVVGFDVSDEKDKAQLRCLAENTGGQFLSASNASELSEALVQVSAPPPPTILDVTFLATEGEKGPQITENLIWNLTAVEGGEAILENSGDAAPALELDQKTRYRIEVLRTSDEAFAEQEFTTGTDGPSRVVLILETPLPDATISGPETVTVASAIPVEWTGPGESGDYVTISKPDSDPGSYESYQTTEGGSPLELKAPGQPGEYELRYMYKKLNVVLATQAIAVEDVAATVTASETATIGSNVSVEWTGPDAENDYITVAKPDAEAKDYFHYAYTRDGTPVTLLMPGVAGEYEIRYVLAHGTRVLASQSITVEEVAATVSAADTAGISSMISVEWTGPDAQNDFIAIAKPDTDGNKYETYAYTRDGSPVKLQVPAQPGDYEIRYILNQGKRILASRKITIEEVGASVSGPETATQGLPVSVEWDGPDARNDYIAVAKPDDEGNRYEHYRYTRDGSPAKLLMPAKPGDYEIRYVLNQDKRILARQPVKVEQAGSRVSGPDSARIASTINVEWEGPDAQSDFIAVATVGSDGNKYVNYRYTRDGSPAKLLMPAKPGTYELRYVLNQGKHILASQAIKIEEAEASVSGPDTASIGSTISVEWVGPDAQNDYIAVSEPGSDDNRYVNYARTRGGSPLKLLMPATAGEYELRYVLNQDKSVLARQSITVEEAKVGLSAPATAEAGYTIRAEWEGPDAQNDYISVAEPGTEGNEYLSYVRTRNGSPLKLEMPAEPGEYEIRYVLNQGKRILARHAISISAATVSLSAKDTVKAEGSINVEWVGPNAQGDRITLALPSMEPKEHMSYRNTSAGSPLALKAPKVPSTYEIRYVTKRGGKILDRQTITVEPK